MQFRPISPQLLAAVLADEFERAHRDTQPLRVAWDAPGFVNFSPLIESVAAELRTRGRPVASIEARDFYRDASLRFEYGRTDVDSFYRGWLDTGSLQREVLVSAATRGQYLPSLRDPRTNRATRADPQRLPANGVMMVRGELLLGAGLSFDLTVHARLSRPARVRLADPDRAWMLPAFDRYDVDVGPAELADIVLRYDDPAHPAVALRR